MKHIQALCKNGHYNWAESGRKLAESCSVCGAPIVWQNEVDDENGDEYGAVPMQLLMITPIVDHPTYRIPTPEETVALASRIDEYGEVRFIASGERAHPILWADLSAERTLQLCLAFMADHDLLLSFKTLNPAEIKRLFKQYEYVYKEWFTAP